MEPALKGFDFLCLFVCLFLLCIHQFLQVFRNRICCLFLGNKTRIKGENKLTIFSFDFSITVCKDSIATKLENDTKTSKHVLGQYEFMKDFCLIYRRETYKKSCNLFQHKGL